MGLRIVLRRHSEPLILLGDFNNDALGQAVYQERLQAWGYRPTPPSGHGHGEGRGQTPMRHP